jgi:type II secretory pathway pseudopilin PulG
MSTAKRKRSRGATLLEILTATSLMASLLAIGIPNLVALRRPYAVAAATRQLEATIQLARMRAIARNAPYRVAIDSATGTYRLERQVGLNWVADGGTLSVPRGATVGQPTPGDPSFNTRGMLPVGVIIPVASGTDTRTLTVNVLGRTTITR